MQFFPLVPFFLIAVTPFLWLLILRPYALKHRKGYTPGAHAGVTMWVNWQEASEISQERGDKVMIAVCRFFLASQILGFGFFLVLPFFL